MLRRDRCNDNNVVDIDLKHHQLEHHYIDRSVTS